jgi:hypothetical protein
MGLFVLLTAYLFQKGSAESKTEEEHEQEQQEEDQERGMGRAEENGGQAPSPIRMGGWAKKLYENSLSIALLTLFLLCFIFHAAQGVREYNQQQAFFNQPPITAWQFLLTSEFWFQSFQNCKASSWRWERWSS